MPSDDLKAAEQGLYLLPGLLWEGLEHTWVLFVFMRISWHCALWHALGFHFLDVKQVYSQQSKCEGVSV